jgi:hypothetical protein
LRPTRRLTLSIPIHAPAELPTDALCASRRYADHVGIHYVLCSKLRQFAYEEIEFFLPQYVVARVPPDGPPQLMRNRLCHLLISVDNESMALEEFIIDLCEESVNGALLVSRTHRRVLLNY